MPPLFADSAATLIVDDDDDDAALLTDLLSPEGYDCVVARDADEALARLSEKEFSLALIDVRLPRQSGLELVEELRGRWPHLAIIMVSGLDDRRLAERAMRSGAYGYIIKPFRPVDLLLTVTNAGYLRGVQIERDMYELRLHKQLEEQAADLEAALSQLKESLRTEVVSESEERFRGLLEAAPDAIVAVDEHGTIMLVNAQTERLFGYDRLDLEGQPVELLVPEALRAEHQRNRATYMAAPHTRPMGAGLPLKGRRSDGSQFPVEISLAATPTPEGQLVSAVVRDITERLEALAERDRLEREAERARVQNRLLQSQRLESLGQLAGGVAHDFNNLLMAIINYARFVGEEISAAAAGDVERDWQAVEQDVGQIELAADRAAQLTRQLLAFGRREVTHPQPLVLNEVVGEVGQLLKRTIGEPIELRHNFDPDLWTVVADRGQVEQVLLNLAINARDAMPTGGTLTIETCNIDLDDTYAAAQPGLQPGRHVRLRVTDSGVGMSAEVIQRAFEPFFTTKPAGSGTGLGLATVYGIVQQAGGHTAIYSEPGMGTTISVTLPASSVSTSLTPLDPAPRAHGSGETVLVVEDEDGVRDVVERILTRWGYVVRTAGSGKAALELLQDPNQHIDLLLSDLVMPGISGTELGRMLRGLRPKVPILYMSGYAHPMVATDPTQSKSLALVMEKPFTEASLLSQVREALDLANRRT